MNKQIGLDNITQLDSYVSMIAKNVLPTKRYLATNPRIVAKPVLAFADRKSVYFCGQWSTSFSSMRLIFQAYLPQSSDKESKYDESLSSSFFGLHVPSDLCPKNLAGLAPSEQWNFVRKSLEGWGQE